MMAHVLLLLLAIVCITTAKEMSLKQMAGQMNQIDLSLSGVLNYNSSGFPSLNKESFAALMSEFNVGSFINGPALTAKQHRSLIKDMVDVSLEVNATVPLFAMDIVHGAANVVLGATIFPQQVNLGATFNTELMEQIGKVTAKDSMASGVQWIFGPVLGIAWDSRFGRIGETFGEDPYLASQMGNSYIRGVQQTNEILNRSVAATAKHFIGYGSSPIGKDRTSSGLSERKVLEYYAPAFQAAIDEGVKCVMEMYDGIDGQPMAASPKYLKLLLRQKMGFQGVLSTDWAEISNLASFEKVCETFEDAVELSMHKTSIDISLTPADTSFASTLLDLVLQGKVSEERVKDSAQRIINLKKQLGILDDPYALLGTDSPLDKTVGSAEDRKLALEATRESIVLLQNNYNTLPLPKDEQLSFLVTGESCNSRSQMSGPWTFGWQVAGSDFDFSYGSTIWQGIQMYSKNTNFVQGYDFEGNLIGIDTLSDITETAREYDYVISCVGEASGTEKPNDLQVSLDIPEIQREFMSAVFDSGTPVIMILIGGRPRLLDGMNERTVAVLDAFYPGPSGGKAIAEILFGDTNPSGRLPYTYPRWASDLPLKYYGEVTDTCFYSMSEYSVPCKHEYNFGQGMSYTTFKYSNAFINASKVDENTPFSISFDITNTGNVPGKETVLLFGSQMTRSLIPELKRLKKFQKVSLSPGETTSVEFILHPREDLSFIGEHNQRIVENSRWTFPIGSEMDCRDGSTQCPGISLNVSASYNPVCESSCNLLVAPRPASYPYCEIDSMDLDQCMKVCRINEWDWSMVSFFEQRLIDEKCLLSPFKFAEIL